MSDPSEQADRQVLAGVTEALATAPMSAVVSVLLAALRRRVARMTGPDVLRAHRRDRFVRPCDLDPRLLLRVDLRIAEVLSAFEAVELAPVVPLGTCAAVAPGSQDRILGTVRGTEVVADPTNALALIAAERRRGGTVVRLAASHRVLRTPPVHQAGFTQHFRLWGLVTAGRDPGGRTFERGALREHVDAHLAILDALRALGMAIPPATVRLRVDPAHAAWVDEALGDLAVESGPLEGSYYQCARFQVHAGDLPISDGGLVDWTAKLRADRKEKLVISGIGTELLARLFPP